MEFLKQFFETVLLLMLFFYFFAGLYHFLLNGEYENADNNGYFILKNKYQKEYYIKIFFLWFARNKIRSRFDKIFLNKEKYKNLFKEYFKEA